MAKTAKKTVRKLSVPPWGERWEQWALSHVNDKIYNIVGDRSNALIAAIDQSRSLYGYGHDNAMLAAEAPEMYLLCLAMIDRITGGLQASRFHLDDEELLRRCLTVIAHVEDDYPEMTHTKSALEA